MTCDCGTIEARGLSGEHAAMRGHGRASGRRTRSRQRKPLHRSTSFQRRM